MNVCRICLSVDIEIDVIDLKVNSNGEIHSYEDIMLFCFNITIDKTAKQSTKLCSKCHQKVLLFYEFKTLALNSDAYMRSLATHYDDIEIVENLEIKVEKEPDDLIFDEPLIEIKEESFIKTEDTLDQSDDECLSILRTIKYELVTDESKENAPIKKKKGRPKLLRLKAKADHRQTHDRVCEECGLSVKNLKEHMYQHQPVEARKQYKCNLCEKVFSSYGARYKHNRAKHLGIKQHCKICDKYILNLAQHSQTIHNKDKLPFECTSCGRRFISQSQLDRHTTTHTKDRPHACNLCDKKFSGYTNLTLHKRQVHDKEKLHLCQFCSKSFFKKYHLQLHVRTHTKEKPYKCLDCDKSFASTTTLSNHRLTHNGEKIFECSLCPMTFIRKGYLRAHMISHTKEKRHECQFCGVRFGRSDHRKRHEFTAHQRHQLPALANTPV